MNANAPNTLASIQFLPPFQSQQQQQNTHNHLTIWQLDFHETNLITNIQHPFFLSSSIRHPEYRDQFDLQTTTTNHVHLNVRIQFRFGMGIFQSFRNATIPYGVHIVLNEFVLGRSIAYDLYIKRERERECKRYREDEQECLPILLQFICYYIYCIIHLT